MARFAYVNGRYVPHTEAAVHVEDRGFQFADGVYEVTAVLGGLLVDEEGHLDRLERSLSELKIAMPMARPAYKLVMRELIRRNGIKDGLVYQQVTRGVAPRDFKFPRHNDSTLVMTARHMNLSHAQALESGVRVVTVPDIRWTRRDIKTVALLPQVLAKQQAAGKGAFEAWMIDPDGTVTEGSSSNAWIVNRDGKLLTRHASNSILKGITRTSILRLCQEEGVQFEERPFTLPEAYEAREAFMSSATSFVIPITQIDDRVIGNGQPGSIALRLRELYTEYAAGRRGDQTRWTA
jgi:D-alanine transaminase